MKNGSGEAGRDERLSALVDGELDAVQVAAVCGQWRDDPDCRERWHSYQLIGDVLRSDDLAAAPAHDADFLSRLRSRLADEPVVVAPAPLESGQAQQAPRTGVRRSGRMFGLAAVAAGFMVVVAGALTFTGLPGGSSPDAVLARSDAPARAPGAGGAAAELEPTVASGELIRDANLDRYLAAHQQWTGSVKLGGHAAYLHSPVDAAPAR